MTKLLLLGSAMMIAAPALAQTAPTKAGTPTAAPQAAPAQTPTDKAMSDQAATDHPTAQPAASADQVAKVVDTEFPTYDKDSSGSLSETEFASWMVALKTASDPSTDAASASTRSWVNNAFASADSDKDKAVSKVELTAFLSRGA